MKRSLIAIIALLTVSIMSAQSKNELKKEFLSLEKQLETVSKKYESKLIALEKDLDKEIVTSEEVNEEELKVAFEDFEKDFSTEDVMKFVVEMHEKDKEGSNSYSFKNDIVEKSTKEDEYMTVLKKLETETLAIENKMYKVAKKYLSKK